jgi:16S rRNA (uracil1498-N3)-methyltransferase
MQIFYTPDIKGMEYYFNEDESKHAIRVLRLNTGDPVHLVDGKGNLFEGVIEDPKPKKCKVLVTNVIHEFEKRSFHLHVAISPLKNPDRFEWFLEKATEIGIDEITPLLCERTEKKTVNHERCNRIVESAMKQSIKAYHPVVHSLVRYDEFIEKAGDSIKMIASCEGDRRLIRECYQPGQPVTILIGPEGDFTENEMAKAQHAGFIPITLGNSRLRTETAGVAVCHSISFLNLVVGY